MPSLDPKPPATGDCAPKAAAANANGTLTAHPNISTSAIPSNYTLLSVNYKLTEDGDERGPLFDLYAEVRNDGFEVDCNIIPTVTLSGIDVIASMNMPPYREISDLVEVSTLSDCFGPGEIGILTGVSRDVRQTDLDAPGDLFVDVSPFNVGFEYEVPSDIPIVTPEIRQTAEGWALGGTLTPVADMFNYGLAIYPRDANGLIVDEIWAYPNELDALYASIDTPFETEATPCEFTDYAMVQTWILGAP